MEKHCPACGVMLTKIRSLADHRRFFASISRAAANWREDHHFQPRDADHLRSWLLVEARYCDVEFIPFAEECADNPAIKALFRMAVEATFSALDRKRGDSFLRVSSGGVEILTPRSINFATLDQKGFGALREAVEGIIELSLGVSVEALLREQAA